MRLITVVKKNIVPILFVGLVIAILIYMTQRKEGFQTPVLGNSCKSATDIISGRCDNTFTFNSNTNRCEKTERYCENNTLYELKKVLGITKCVKKSDRNIKIPPLSRLVVQSPPNYKCNNGYVSIGNFRCAKSGTFVCPSGFPQQSNRTCANCTHVENSVYSAGDMCKNRDNPAISVSPNIRHPICSA